MTATSQSSTFVVLVVTGAAATIIGGIVLYHLGYGTMPIEDNPATPSLAVVRIENTTPFAISFTLVSLTTVNNTLIEHASELQAGVNRQFVFPNVQPNGLGIQAIQSSQASYHGSTYSLPYQTFDNESAISRSSGTLIRFIQDSPNSFSVEYHQ